MTLDYDDRSSLCLSVVVICMLSCISSHISQFHLYPNLLVGMLAEVSNALVNYKIGLKFSMCFCWIVFLL